MAVRYQKRANPNPNPNLRYNNRSGWEEQKESTRGDLALQVVLDPPVVVNSVRKFITKGRDNSFPPVFALLKASPSEGKSRTPGVVFVFGKKRFPRGEIKESMR